MKHLIKQRFAIQMNSDIAEIMEKYSNCKECFALNQAEQSAFALFDRLPEYERILFVLFAELGSCRKVAEMVGTSHETANRAFRDLKQAVKTLI